MLMNRLVGGSGGVKSILDKRWILTYHDTEQTKITAGLSGGEWKDAAEGK